jgi:uncharacterized membrane protein YciS (DUF1049 family)
MLFGVTFAILNSEQVAFNYYFATKQMSLALLLVFTFGIGILIGLIFTAISIIKAKAENRRLKSRLKTAEKEIENLRAIPLKKE